MTLISALTFVQGLPLLLLAVSSTSAELGFPTGLPSFCLCHDHGHLLLSLPCRQVFLCCNSFSFLFRSLNPRLPATNPPRSGKNTDSTACLAHQFSQNPACTLLKRQQTCSKAACGGQPNTLEGHQTHRKPPLLSRFCF